MGRFMDIHINWETEPIPCPLPYSSPSRWWERKWKWGGNGNGDGDGMPSLTSILAETVENSLPKPIDWEL